MMQIDVILIFVCICVACFVIGSRWGRMTYQDELTDLLEEYIREKGKERKDKGGQDGSDKITTDN